MLEYLMLDNCLIVFVPCINLLLKLYNFFHDIKDYKIQTIDNDL